MRRLLPLLLLASCVTGEAASLPDGGPALLPDGGPALLPDGGPALLPDGGPALLPDAGPAPAAACPVPDMLQLYSGLLPPNPYGSWVPKADDCVSGRHDAIVLLGCPSNADGSPSPSQQVRVQLGLELRAAGVAQDFIVSGAAVHNQWVEAQSLHDQLVAAGVAEEHIFLDLKANHTDENLYYSSHIMDAHGWRSAVVVSDDPGQIIMTATCDSNCCVALGRLTIMDFQTPARTIRAGHYALFPEGAAVSGVECKQIERSVKAMCTNLASRLACKGNVQLPP